MIPLLLLISCKGDAAFDLSGVWRFEVQVTPTPEDACESRLLHNVVDAIEDGDGEVDTGSDGWTEESETEWSALVTLGRFVRDGDRWLLIAGGELFPQEEGGDAASPTFAWERSERSREEKSHASGYSWVAESNLSDVTRIQVGMPNEQQQTDAERTGVPVTLEGTWTQETGATSSWEEADLWPEELGLGETGAIPFGSYLTRLDSLGYVVPVSNQRAVADCSDDVCVLTVSDTCAESWTFTATPTEIEAGDPGWQDLQWEAGY